MASRSIVSKNRSNSAVGALLVAAAACGSHAQSITYRPIMLSGQQAPGLPAGVVFDEAIGTGYTPMPAINDASMILFGAHLAGPGVTADNRASYWLVDTEGNYTLLLRAGSPIGNTGEVMSYITRVAMSDDGAVVFRGGFESIHPAAAVYQRDPDGSVTILARPGDTPPDAPAGAVFNSLASNSTNNQNLVMSGNGRSVFVGTTRVDDTIYPLGGIWSSDAGGPLAKIVADGDATEAGSDTLTFTHFGSTVAADRAGRVYFVADELLNGAGATEHLWVWEETAGFRKLASEGDPLPTMSSNNVLGQVVGGRLAFNDAGQFAARIEVRNPQPGSWTGIAGIWMGSQNGLESLAMRRGRPVPGFPSGSQFKDPGVFSLNGSGRLAFTAEFAPSDEPTEGIGIWTRSPSGALSLVVRDGEPMPGSDGLTFESVAVAALSNNNQLVFSGRAVDPNAPVWPVQYLGGTFLASTGGTIVPIGIEGQAIDINPDPAVTDARTLASAPTTLYPVFGASGVLGNGPESGQGVVFNSGGEFVFRAAFDDGTSGVFVATFDNGCPADTNGDDLLTPADFNAWVLAFNSGAPACDQNGDGLCTPADFNAWIANFNAGC